MMLQSQIGSVVKALHKQLREKSVKTRQVSHFITNKESIQIGKMGSGWMNERMEK